MNSCQEVPGTMKPCIIIYQIVVSIVQKSVSWAMNLRASSVKVGWANLFALYILVFYNERKMQDTVGVSFHMLCLYVNNFAHEIKNSHQLAKSIFLTHNTGAP